MTSDTVSPVDQVVDGLTRNPVVSALAMVGIGILPVIGLFSGALLALVLLDRGYARAFLALGLAVIGLALIGRVTGQGTWPAVWNPLASPVSGLWLPIIVVAGVLRSGRSLALAIMVAGLLACVAVIAQLMLMPDPVGFWHMLLGQWLEPLRTIEHQGAAQWRHGLEAMARQMPGMMAAGMMVVGTSMLLLARYFQARLSRPGAFGDEFRRLRLGMAVAIAGSVVLTARVVVGGPVLDNLAIVALALFLFQGLAVIHALRFARGWPRWGLIAFYVLLVAFTLWVVGVVSGAGLVDNWFDFRRLRRPPEA